MRMNITWGRVKEGVWSEYERIFLRADAIQPGLNGPTCRWLLRDIDDADAGFSVSLWETSEALQEYRLATRELRENQFGALFVNQYFRYECEVRVVSPGALDHLKLCSRVAALPTGPAEHTPSQT